MKFDSCCNSSCLDLYKLRAAELVKGNLPLTRLFNGFTFQSWQKAKGILGRALLEL